MGRNKIPIEKIQSDKSRQATFTKRKNGLFKKAMELSILCDCEIALIIFGQNQRLFQYSSSDLNEILNKLKKNQEPPLQSLSNDEYHRTFASKETEPRKPKEESSADEEEFEDTHARSSHGHDSNHSNFHQRVYGTRSNKHRNLSAPEVHEKRRHPDSHAYQPTPNPPPAPTNNYIPEVPVHLYPTPDLVQPSTLNQYRNYPGERMQTQAPSYSPQNYDQVPYSGEYLRSSDETSYQMNPRASVFPDYQPIQMHPQEFLNSRSLPQSHHFRNPAPGCYPPARLLPEQDLTGLIPISPLTTSDMIPNYQIQTKRYPDQQTWNESSPSDGWRPSPTIQVPAKWNDEPPSPVPLKRKRFPSFDQRADSNSLILET